MDERRERNRERGRCYKSAAQTYIYKIGSSNLLLDTSLIKPLVIHISSLFSQWLMVCLCVFQTVIHSAGGWEVQVQARSRSTGVELCQEASSVPVACRIAVWIEITTATVTQTTTNGADIY